MILFHDSRDPLYRDPVGATPCGGTVRLRLNAVSGCDVTLRLWINDKEYKQPMTDGGEGLYETELALPKEPALVWYYFIVKTPSGKQLFYGNAADGKGGAGGIYPEEPQSFQITAYDPNWDTPHWMRNGVMMQIMVDRFCSSGPKNPKGRLRGRGFYHETWDEPPVIPTDPVKGDLGAVDFFGGDLKGLTSRLPYLKQMGISVLYLNPIFQAASNHKYDTCDYMKIDPSFGTESDFIRMTQTASRLGIRVMLDGVFSHTGADSRYFNKRGAFKEPGAYQSRESRYYSWFNFKHWPDDYEAWWGFKEHPNVNELNPDYQDFIIRDEDSVVAHWLKAGASGWRLDVADELPMDFIRAIRVREKQLDPDAALLGEVWEDPSNKLAYEELRCYCLGDTLDSTMNYTLRDALVKFMLEEIDSNTLKRTLDSLMENVPNAFSYSMMNMLGTHDKPRIINVMADVGDMEPPRSQRTAMKLSEEAYRHGARRSIAAWRFLCAFPGMPSVYYGDDAGCQGMGDPFCRGTYPWNNINERIHRAYVEAISTRNANDVLRNGLFRLYAPDPDVIVLERYYEEGKDAFGREAKGCPMMLALNRSPHPRHVIVNERSAIINGESALWMK